MRIIDYHYSRLIVLAILLTQHLRPFLVLLALLAYGSQSFAMLSSMLPDSHKSLSVEYAMPHCHSDDTQTNNSAIKSSEHQQSHDCCKGSCAMLGCHATSVLVSNILALQFNRACKPLQGFQVHALSTPPSDIYHPPIVG